jgi:ferric iron reductase protein FhuF
MIAALAPLYTGPFASYREVLVTAADPRPSVAATRLLEPECLEPLLQRFAPEYAGQDRRALASQWSKYYLVKLIPPVVAAALVLQRQLPLDFDQVQVVLNAQGLPEAFKLTGEGEVFAQAPQDPFERFGHLLDGHLQPFVQRLASQVKLSPKVLWSNAGNYFEWFLGEMAQVPIPAQVLAHGQALLAAERRPDGSRNPLFAPIRYLEVPCEVRAEGRWRQRRVCCVRYRLEALPHCENCPLLDRPPPHSLVS